MTALDAILDVFRYELPIKTMVPGIGGSRSGLIIRLSDKDGGSGLGEAAPLHGFSRETLADAEKLFTDLPDRLPFARLVRYCNKLWSTAFAVDSALRQLESATSPSDSVSSAVDTYALAGLADPNGLHRGLASVAAGATIVKFKVGVGRLVNEAAIVRDFRAESSQSVRIVLDANRRWSYENAIEFWREAGPDRILYIEEPLHEIGRLRALNEETGMPVGLDESVVRRDTEAFDPSVAAALVLKPMLLGGWDVCQALGRLAKDLGCGLTVTTAFESGVGTLGVARLVGQMSSDGLAPLLGLDTYLRLGADIIAPRLQLTPRTIDVGAMIALPRVLLDDGLRHVKTITIAP